MPLLQGFFVISCKWMDGLTVVSDREIPLPPLFYDFGFHLVPAVVLSLDSVLLSPPWPTTPMNESAPMITLAMSTIVAFAYWIWIVSAKIFPSPCFIPPVVFSNAKIRKSATLKTASTHTQSSSS